MYGLTMEGRAHQLCSVGNSFMSRHHKARYMEGAPQCTERSIPQGEGKMMMMMMVMMMMMCVTLVCFCVFTTQCAERSIPQGGRVR